MKAMPQDLAQAAASAVPPVCFDLRGVRVQLGSAGRRPALDHIFLRIAEGERVALVGANGSGKSTLLRTLHRLQPVAAGEIHTPDQRQVAMLFQRPHMLRLSARRNIALGLWMQGVPWRETRARALQALAKVELADIADRNARALSGGQQQRLALARAWALQPDVWLLDEPLNGLDDAGIVLVERLIAEHRFTGGTVVVASHQPIDLPGAQVVDIPKLSR